MIYKKREIKEFLKNKNFKGEQIELLAGVYESLADKQKAINDQRKLLSISFFELHLDKTDQEEI